MYVKLRLNYRKRIPMSTPNMCALPTPYVPICSYVHVPYSFPYSLIILNNIRLGFEFCSAFRFETRTFEPGKITDKVSPKSYGESGDKLRYEVSVSDGSNAISKMSKDLIVE